MNLLTVPRLIIRFLVPCLVLLLAFSVVAAEEATRLSRAYNKPKRFSKTDADTLFKVGPIQIHQAPYDGSLIRADDTMGAKLQRIFLLSENLSDLPIMDILLIDSAGPQFKPSSPLNAPLRICTYILRSAHDEVRHPDCQNVSTNTLTIAPTALIHSKGRSRLQSGMLNEIGHRIAAEAIFAALLGLKDVFSQFEPPVSFRKRINIYPNNNERLASIRHPDS